MLATLMAAGSLSLEPAHAQTTALVMGGTAQPTPSLWAMQNGLDGILAGDILVPVTTPAQWWPLVGTLPWDQSVAGGVQNIIDAVMSTSGSLVVFGYSQSSYIADLAAHELAAIPGAPTPDQLTFIVTANIGRPGGLLSALPEGVTIFGTTFTGGAQEDSPYDFIDVAYEYDGIARWPTNSHNLVADANAILGAIYFHGAYSEVNLADIPADYITRVVNSAGGTTTYYVVPQPDLPLLKPLRDIGVDASIVDALNTALTPVVKAGYAPKPAADVVESTGTVAVAPAVKAADPADPAARRRHTPAATTLVGPSRKPPTANGLPSAAAVRPPRGISGSDATAGKRSARHHKGPAATARQRLSSAGS